MARNYLTETVKHDAALTSATASATVAAAATFFSWKIGWLIERGTSNFICIGPSPVRFRSTAPSGGSVLITIIAPAHQPNWHISSFRSDKLSFFSSAFAFFDHLGHERRPPLIRRQFNNWPDFPLPPSITHNSSYTILNSFLLYSLARAPVFLCVCVGGGNIWENGTCEDREDSGKSRWNVLELTGDDAFWRMA